MNDRASDRPDHSDIRGWFQLFQSEPTTLREVTADWTATVKQYLSGSAKPDDFPRLRRLTDRLVAWCDQVGIDPTALTDLYSALDEIGDYYFTSRTEKMAEYVAEKREQAGTIIRRINLAAVIHSDPSGGSPVSTGESALAPSEKPVDNRLSAARKQPRPPTQDAWYAWHLCNQQGLKQEDAAEKLEEYLHRPYDQSKVSRRVRSVREYLGAGGEMPEAIQNALRSMDPELLDMGRRQDPREPRPSELAE